MTRLRKGNAITVAGLLLILAAVNFSIWKKEVLLERGTTVLLRLAPVDPRSLMQGDYMRLDYDLVRRLPHVMDQGETTQRVHLSLDANAVATAIEPAGAGGPAADGAFMLMRKRNGRGWRIGSDAYYFQEGTAALYGRARYGEYRTDVSGESVLVALRDESFARMGVYRLGDRWQVPSAMPPAPGR